MTGYQQRSSCCYYIALRDKSHFGKDESSSWNYTERQNKMLECFKVHAIFRHSCSSSCEQIFHARILGRESRVFATGCSLVGFFLRLSATRFQGILLGALFFSQFSPHRVRFIYFACERDWATRKFAKLWNILFELSKIIEKTYYTVEKLL